MNRAKLSLPRSAVAVVLSAGLLLGVHRQKNLEIGGPVPRTTAKAELGVCMVSPGQLDKCVKLTEAGVEYTIAFRRMNWLRGSRVTYVHTVDANFRSQECMRVGDTVTVRSRSDLIAAPGFEVYALKKTGGWQPVIGFAGSLITTIDGAADLKVNIDQLKDNIETRVRVIGFTKR